MNRWWLAKGAAKVELRQFRWRTDTFHIPDLEMLSKPKVLFRDLVELEDSAIGAVIGSLHTFTREKRIDLLKANFQFAAEESEH